MIKNFSNNYFQFSYDQSQQDIEASGINILNIRYLEFLVFSKEAEISFKKKLDEYKKNKIEFISLRTEQDFMLSKILSQNNFVFIETLFKPELILKNKFKCNSQLKIEEAVEKDMMELKKIAATSFVKDRFHFDKRFNKKVGGNRYSFWVENAFLNKNLLLLKITLNKEIIGFFILEYSQEKNVYWHLTAIKNKFQGKGLGYDIWKSFLNRHYDEGILKVQTAISSNNIPALNLYSKLSFKFSGGLNTYHKFLD